jgi:hypothetical protein
MVNNSAGQIQGFMEAGGEFVRTPKSNRRPGAPAAKSSVRTYASPLHWTFFAELIVIGYCLLTAALLMSRGEAPWAVPLVFWAMCLGLVAQMQMSPKLA